MSIRRSSYLAVLFATATTLAFSAPLYRPPGLRQSPTLDLTWRVSVHNAFWHGDPSQDAAASGPKQHLADDLYIDRARGLEFDLHSDPSAGEFKVYHTSNEGYSLCRHFASCLDVVRAFHFGNPGHDPLFLHLEAKETSGGRFFTPAGLTPQDLDGVLRVKLADNGKQWMYTPNEYLTWCENVEWPALHPDPAKRPPYNVVIGNNLRKAVRYCGWPTLDQLRGRIIATLHGTFNSNEVDVDDYSHSYSRTIRDVMAFPMASLVGRGVVSDCGLSGVCNWDDDSVVEDVGTLDGSQYLGPPLYGNPSLYVTSLRLDHGLARSDATTTVEMDALTHSLKGIQFFAGQPVPGFTMINTDAPRNNPINYPGLPYAALPVATGCLYYPNSNNFFPGCSLVNLPEPGSGIEVHAWGYRNGLGSGNTSDQMIYLAQQIPTGQAGDFRAFVSTRTDNLQGKGTEPNLGFSMTGNWGCVMARETLAADSAYVAICRYRHRLSWDSSVDGVYVLTRPRTGMPTQAYYYDTTSADDGSGPPELDAYFQLTHDATGRCFGAKKRFTEDPSALPVQMLAGCFPNQMQYIGLATDGGSDDRGPGPVRGDYLFANVRYNNKVEGTASLIYNNLGMPREAEVIDRTFVDGFCAPEITSLVEVIPGGYSRVGFYNYYVQQVTLRNTTGKPIQGPVSFGVAGLTEGVTLNNPSGTTTCKDPISPYMNVPLPADGVWGAGQTVTVNLSFSSPGNKQIRYSPYVMMSGGRL